MRRLILGAALFASLASSGSEGGERANGGCPEGETCSPATPDGLSFTGASFGDRLLTEGVPDLALGGVQTIAVTRDGAPYSPFMATSSGAAFEVDPVDSSHVRLSGLSVGEDYLRLVEPGTELLLDRIAVRVAPAAELAIVPHELDLQNDAELTAAFAPDVLFHESAGFGATVALLDSTGVRLVDESLSLALPALLSPGQNWDHIDFDAADGSGETTAGEYSVAYTLGDGRQGSLDFRVVDQVDEVIAVVGTGDEAENILPSEGLDVGEQRRLCFRASLDGVPVVGAPFTFEATGGLRVSPASGCARVTGDSSGIAELVVTSGELAVAFTVVVR